MKKTVLAAGIAGLVAASLVGCGKSGTTSGNGDANGNITVISREEGSGTRGAFVEITGVEQKNADGKKEDIFKVVLPAAVPGILSGIILAIGRIVGETAALLYTSGTATRGLSKGLMSSGRTLAVHMYTISSEGFHTKQTFATAVILLIFVFIINTLSSVAAKQISKKAGGQ